MTKNLATMINPKSWGWLVMLLCMCACQSDAVFEEYQDVSPTAWDMNNPAHFEVAINDTTGHYDVILHIRNTDSYPYQDLWLFTHSTAPDSTVALDTLACFLADNQGKWLGEGLLSEYDMPLLYMSNIRFPKEGTYTFDIAHGMRDSLLQGISRIGLTVEPTKVNTNVEK